MVSRDGVHRRGWIETNMRPDEKATELAALIPRLRRYAFALARDPDLADDLVQDCLEKAVGHWWQRREGGDLRAWAFSILHNVFISRMRTRSRRGIEVGHEAIDAEVSVEGDHESRLQIRDVTAGLATLPEEQRAVLLMVAVEGMSYEEAARAMNIPVGTVMSRLARARETLRRYMESGAPVPLRRVK